MANSLSLGGARWELLKKQNEPANTVFEISNYNGVPREQLDALVTAGYAEKFYNDDVYIVKINENRDKIGFVIDCKKVEVSLPKSGMSSIRYERLGTFSMRGGVHPAYTSSEAIADKITGRSARQAQNLENLSSELTFITHMIPFGAASDYAINQGKNGEAFLALAGDLATPLAFAKKAYKVKIAIAVQGGIIACRVTQIADGGDGWAAGGEIALRLVITAAGAYRLYTIAKLKNVPQELPRVAQNPPKPIPNKNPNAELPEFDPNFNPAVKLPPAPKNAPAPTGNNVAIVDSRGAKLGEFDRIEGGKFIEDKSAAGVGKINPKTGQPYPGSSAAEWAQRNIFDKTKVRIENLQKAARTIPEEGGTRAVPSLAEIQGIRTIEFEISSLTPELKAAVDAQIAALKAAFPDWTFVLR